MKKYLLLIMMVPAICILLILPALSQEEMQVIEDEGFQKNQRPGEHPGRCPPPRAAAGPHALYTPASTALAGNQRCSSAAVPCSQLL